MKLIYEQCGLRGNERGELFKSSCPMFPLVIPIRGSDWSASRRLLNDKVVQVPIRLYHSKIGFPSVGAPFGRVV